MKFLKSVIVLLILVFAVPEVVSISTPPPVNDVILYASTTKIEEGYTRELVLNCSFSKQATSDVDVVTSLTLSKTDQQNDTDYKQIAIITQSSGQNVTVNNNLGATIKGQTILNGDSFILFEWSYPPTKAAGKYQCLVSGLNNLGQVLHESALVTIENESVDLHTLLDRINNLENTQAILVSELDTTKNILNQTNLDLSFTNFELNKTKHELIITQQASDVTKFSLNRTQTELDLTKSELNSTQIELELTKAMFENVNMTMIRRLLTFLPFEDFMTYNNHLYLLSVEKLLNVSSFDEICQQNGGTLAQIDDENEMAAVCDFLEGAVKNDQMVLVDGTNLNSSGNWTYHGTEEPIPFTKWGYGEPSGSSMYCLAIYVGTLDMSAYYCDYATITKRFLCEIP